MAQKNIGDRLERWHEIQSTRMPGVKPLVLGQGAVSLENENLFLPSHFLIQKHSDSTATHSPVSHSVPMASTCIPSYPSATSLTHPSIHPPICPPTSTYSFVPSLTPTPLPLPLPSQPPSLRPPISPAPTTAPASAPISAPRLVPDGDPALTSSSSSSSVALSPVIDSIDHSHGSGSTEETLLGISPEFARLAEEEAQLRETQLFECILQLRSVGKNLSILQSIRRKEARGQQQNTRSRAHIEAMDLICDQILGIYNASREKLLVLKGGNGGVEKYSPLSKDDLSRKSTVKKRQLGDSRRPDGKLWYTGKSKGELLDSINASAAVAEEEELTVDVSKLWSPLIGLSNAEIERWEREGM